MATTRPLLEDEVQEEAALARIEAKLDRLVAAEERLSRRVEELGDLKADLLPIADGLMATATRELSRMEGAGTLAFAREALGVAERITQSFTPEDVRALGENVVSILTTVRNFTQPDMLDVADRAVQALREDPEEAEGVFWLLKQMKDPETRRGLGLMLSVLRQLGGRTNGDATAQLAVEA